MFQTEVYTMSATHEDHSHLRPGYSGSSVSCRTCTDFKAWMKVQGKTVEVGERLGFP